MVMMDMTVTTRRIIMSMAVMLTGGQTYQRTDGHAYGQPGAYLTYMCGKYRPIAIHEKTKKQLHIHYKSERHTVRQKDTSETTTITHKHIYVGMCKRPRNEDEHKTRRSESSTKRRQIRSLCSHMYSTAIHSPAPQTSLHFGLLEIHISTAYLHTQNSSQFSLP